MIWRSGLHRPLTPTEMKVARLVSVGYDYARIGDLLGMAEATAGVHVGRIAMKLSNPDDLKPFTLVLLWAAEQRFLEIRKYAA